MSGDDVVMDPTVTVVGRNELDGYWYTVREIEGGSYAVMVGDDEMAVFDDYSVAYGYAWNICRSYGFAYEYE